MISFLRGRVRMRSGGTVTLDVNGVGYSVEVSARTLEDLGPADGDVEVFVHTQVREDAITLFGFAGAGERATFLLLQSVQGVGPKAALALLSEMDPHEAVDAIAAGDMARLSKAQGVGPKLASRICSELAEKAKALSLARSPANPGTAAAFARSALEGLGYGTGEAARLAAAAQAYPPPPGGWTVASLTTAALRAAVAGRQGS